jgi:hypothetical protein
VPLFCSVLFSKKEERERKTPCILSRISGFRHCDRERSTVAEFLQFTVRPQARTKEEVLRPMHTVQDEWNGTEHNITQRHKTTAAAATTTTITRRITGR